jgi:serine phosphatase RsbU (regulator of sigma subunit)
MKWSNKILNVGLDGNEDTEYSRHAHVVNSILFITCFFSALYLPVLLILKKYLYFFIQTGCTALCCFGYFFSSKKMFRAAAYYMYANIFLILLLFVIIANNNIGAEFTMIPAALSAFIAFRHKKDALVIFSAFILYCAIAQVLRHYLPIVPVDEKIRIGFYYMNIFFSFMASGAVIINFQVAVEKHEKIILLQKTEIEDRSREITDSINYAKRIQQATLTPEDELKKHFSDCFVFLKPKDVVSGDFYWFSESPTNRILAVADCTGHGVPGAFMSMLAFEMLQTTLLLEEVSTTSEAFSRLDKKITETLNRNNRSHRDGMDMALCAFSKSSNKVQFSGANRPVILIRDKKIIEFPPDKQTIGGGIDNISKQFHSTEIETKKGDLFYFFSDGYADQFGGPKEKKFMLKQFKDLLLLISDHAMTVQKKMLDETLADWRGGYEQTDDILVVGIKI